MDSLLQHCISQPWILKSPTPFAMPRCFGGVTEAEPTPHTSLPHFAITGLDKSFLCCITQDIKDQHGMTRQTPLQPLDYQHVIMWDLMLEKGNKYFMFSNDKYAYAVTVVMFVWSWPTCFNKYHAKYFLERVQDTEVWKLPRINNAKNSFPSKLKAKLMEEY